jgi:hypothetical protein
VSGVGSCAGRCGLTCCPLCECVLDLVPGEATHPSQAGMTHGAMEEGQRAAAWCLSRGMGSVVVVGAGVSGLACAASLATAGVRVVVVEARDRVGGRIHSIPLPPASLPIPSGDAGASTLAPGVVVELGANWLQQGDRNTLAPLAASQGLVTVPTDFHAPLAMVTPWSACGGSGGDSGGDSGCGGGVDSGAPPSLPSPPGPALTEAVMQGLCDRIAAHASAGRADLSLTGLLEAWAREAPFGTPTKPWTAADEAYVVAGEVRPGHASA